MHQVKCIEKIRDKNNHIIKYKLIDNDKNTISLRLVKSDELKEAIKSGQIEVINLTLTSDNRLVDKKTDTPSKPTVTHSKQESKTESLLNRVKSLCYNVKSFDTECCNKCYIASSSDNTKHIFIIPDDVNYIYDSGSNWGSITTREIHVYLSNIKGALRVIGGKGLISAYYLFNSCGAHSIDLTSFDTSNIRDMRGMFSECRAQFIDLSSFNTSKAAAMGYMFYGCKARSLDLSSFNTSKVTDMHGMFHKCQVHSLDLRSFDTSNVIDMAHMFDWCEVHALDLSSFNTSNVKNMSNMFAFCEAQSIDLRSFDTSNVEDMSRMFSCCEAQSVDLSSFNTSSIKIMTCMFKGCKAQIKVNDPKLKVQLQ